MGASGAELRPHSLQPEVSIARSRCSLLVEGLDHLAGCCALFLLYRGHHGWMHVVVIRVLPGMHPFQPCCPGHVQTQWAPERTGRLADCTARTPSRHRHSTAKCCSLSLIARGL